jgi:hypothetical protein
VTKLWNLRVRGGTPASCSFLRCWESVTGLNSKRSSCLSLQSPRSVHWIFFNYHTSLIKFETLQRLHSILLGNEHEAWSFPKAIVGVFSWEQVQTLKVLWDSLFFICRDISQKKKDSRTWTYSKKFQSLGLLSPLFYYCCIGGT